jgi:Response regulators consisting of a CheY-like receiver domain and a winged-helix DNA-binding domain
MKILLVEDDFRISKAIAEALREQRYVVEMVGDGESGLAFAETGSFDLIVLDLMLPKLDGISLCRKLRQAGNKNPDSDADSTRYKLRQSFWGWMLEPMIMLSSPLIYPNYWRGFGHYYDELASSFRLFWNGKG